MSEIISSNCIPSANFGMDGNQFRKILLGVLLRPFDFQNIAEKLKCKVDLMLLFHLSQYGTDYREYLGTTGPPCA